MQPSARRREGEYGEHRASSVRGSCLAAACRRTAQHISAGNNGRDAAFLDQRRFFQPHRCARRAQCFVEAKLQPGVAVLADFPPGACAALRTAARLDRHAELRTIRQRLDRWRFLRLLLPEQRETHELRAVALVAVAVVGCEVTSRGVTWVCYVLSIGGLLGVSICI